MPIFDTHAHYDADRFDSDRDALLSAMPGAGVGTGAGPGMRPALIPCGGRAGGTVPACVRRRGHPSGGLRRLPGRRPDGTAAAFWSGPRWWPSGRSDWTTTGRTIRPRAFQQTVFRKQLALAAELDLPVIVHDREAHGDCLAIIKEFPTVTGVFHCFSGSPEVAAELLKRGWYLGFDGPITYKNAKRAPEVAAVTPLERIVVETDAPYMAPVPMRGKRNDSRYLPYVIEKLAEWKGVTAEEMTRVTWENGRRLFRI